MKNKGITLVALVVTIVIMLILAGVALNIALSENGLFSQAQRAVGEYENSATNEDATIQEATKIIENLINRPLVSTVTDTTHADNAKVQDSLGNPLVIPSGFKYKEGTNVEDGIVIEDKDRNQFVWIPVSNIDGSKTGLIKTTNKGNVEITLGRYIFDGDGNPTLKQSGSKYSERSNETKVIENGVNIYEDTHEPNRANGGVGAKELDKFIQSVQENHGYYLARYEAGEGNEGKPVSKVGAVWTGVNQPAASEAAQKMYDENEKFVSDLVNSYAWDTAIVFIEKMEENNYANANRDTTGNNSLLNTGDTKDVKCNIYDMAGNVREWTTEYSANLDARGKYPCVLRGGGCNGSNYCTALRYCNSEIYSDGNLGFRPLLYLR